MPRGSIDEQTELIKIYGLLGTYLASLDTDLGTALAALTAMDNVIDHLADHADRAAFSLDFWSAVQEEVQVGSGAANVSLPSVTISIPTGYSLVRAQAIFKFRSAENTNAAANKLSGAQYIQGSSNGMVGTWVNAIEFPDDAIGLAAATREGGDAFIGNSDIKAQIGAATGTFYFRWGAATADQNYLQFNDVQMGLRVWFR